ncbi:MAG: Chaperone protein DnaJ [Dehalococcoidia bacterium]|nr:Chaperone protein DnaJ [Bacillota bacterium]
MEEEEGKRDAEMSNYIYGVIQAERGENFGSIGIGGGDEVYTVLHDSLAAVVSDSGLPALTSLAREEIVRYLFSHQSVIEKVMKEHTIIPLKFGTTASSVEETKRILERGYPRFKDALKAMEGKVELDVVATWNKDMVFKDISQEEQIIKFKQELGSQPSTEDKVKLGRMVEAHLSKRKEMLAPEIIGALAEVAQDFCLHDTLDATMLINTAFLIEKGKGEPFDQKLDEIDKKYEGRINFRRVGPLPPYSFSTAEVKKAEFTEIEKARNLLALGEEATSSQIKQAYWNLSSEYHPDKHPGDTEIQKRFEDISKAYELLADYCQGENCSFREKDVNDFIKVDIVRIGKLTDIS